YEKLGLLAPERSAAGQRLYDSDALLTLAKIRLLKQAGIPLDLIKTWLDNPLDARGLIAAQLDYLRDEADRIAQSILLLKQIDSEIERAGAQTVDHLARIIASSDDGREAMRARHFFEKHFTPSQRNDWRDMMARLQQEVDPVAYDTAWRSLIDDIKAALPIDPTSETAQGLLGRWNALLEPFQRVASSEQQAMASTMWENVGEWGAHARQPATQDVINFIRAAMVARAEGVAAPIDGTQ
ncbi:MAG: MerR family transcriptional regulator, partial [Pseudomonadota bacterium]